MAKSLDLGAFLLASSSLQVTLWDVLTSRFLFLHCCQDADGKEVAVANC